MPLEKRRRAAAVQNLSDTLTFLNNAKRLGLRQPSGALQEDEMSARFPRELLCANDNMNCYGW
jgi:hypothetical protein